MAERRKKPSMLALGFAGRLKKLREAKGLTQKDLAKRVEIEVVQISRYERGQYLPNAETLVTLSRVLQVDLNFLLLGDSTAMTPQSVQVLDLPLLERFQDLQKLPKRSRDAIILLIDSVLTRGDVETRLRKGA